VLLAEADWPQIEVLRERIGRAQADSLQVAAQAFCGLFTEQFSSVVLARMFVVVPLASLPAGEKAFARELVHGDERLTDSTPVLSLLGTRGSEAEWNDRSASRAHLAIPLLDSSFVQDAPMIAKLLADLEVDLKNLDDGRLVVTRRMLGGRNASFFVADAPEAVDAKGRAIIPAQDFVRRHSVRTVFGMGGAYVDGMMVITIIFSQEALPRLTVDRFPSLISNFKMTTAQLAANKTIYAQRSA
jgi:hypothetical protein